MGEFKKIISFGFFLIFIKLSLEEIIIPVNPVSEENGPTIMTRETFTVQSNDGTPIRITRIGFHRNGRNLNGNNRDRQTPLALMRLMDDTISSIFEEIISQRIGFNLIRGKREEENKNENNDNKNEQEKNNKENKDNNDNKEFELDENKDNKDNKDKKDNSKAKEEGKPQQNITTQENKTLEDNKDNNKKNITNTSNTKQEKKSGEKKKMIGKLKVNPDSLKPKKRKGKKKLSRKEIIFSRICKYIFYSIILFTLYVLIRKLLELLEIIDPETDLGLKQVKTNNEEELRKKENDIVLNKKKENKQY